MRKAIRNKALPIACALALVTAFGCSVINSFDAVKPARSDGGAGSSSGGTAGSGGGTNGGTGGTSGSGGADASAGSGGTAGTAGTAGSGGSSGAPDGGDAGGSGGNAGSGGTAGGGGTGGSDAGPVLPGLVVESAVNSQGNAVLAAIDPYTGKELAEASQSHYAHALVYDSLRDIWFVFIPNGNTSPATLEVRTFDKASKKWTLLKSTSVPAPMAIGNETVAVLNQYILYASRVPQDGAAPKSGFTLLDTSNASNVTVVGQSQIAQLPPTLIGLNAWPGNQAGGRATMIVEGACNSVTSDAGATENVCPIQLASATVDNSGNLTVDSTLVPAAQVAQASRPTFTANHVSGLEADVLVLPPLFSGDPNQVLSFDIFSHTQSASADFTMGGPQWAAAAYDPCLDLVIAGELNTPGVQGIYVFPRLGGTPAKLGLSTVAQSVLYEPYTHTVIRPYTDTQNYQLSAFTLGGTKTSPTLSARISPPWNPPGLNPELVAVATPPSPVNCTP